MRVGWNHVEQMVLTFELAGWTGLYILLKMVCGSFSASVFYWWQLGHWTGDATCPS